ncbi:MAG TPA: transposase family protein [Pyrinomonadaceae bacterium]|nr:transposase family protein [Pyrinomonadaceae bacterium]
MRLSLNTIIKWETDEGKSRFERVLHVDAPSSEVWTIDVHYERAVPVFYRYEELQNSILSNRAQITLNYEPYPLITLPDEQLGEGFAEYIKRRDSAWELIRPLIKMQAHNLFNRKERRRLIVELAKRTSRSENTIYLNLRRYWQRGCVKNALLPDWHKCGSAKQRKDHGKKRGRPSAETLQTGRQTGRNVTSRDREIFREGVEKFFKSGMAKDLPSTWGMIKEQFYSTGEYTLKSGLEGDDIVPILLPPDERPSFEQFRYYYYQERNPSEEIIALEGQDEYDRNIRPVLNNSTEMAFGPGAVYQIDATVGDIYLVNDFNREYLIGRPVIYIVIDTFSRLIVGFAVTLEGPSWVGAKMALENAFKNKVEFCRGLGINITEDEWPVQGICESLLGDNGEIKGYNANSLVDPFGIRVSNAAVGRPDWKAIVERNFLTIKGEYVDFTPGVIRPRRHIRGQYYKLEARLSLLGFRRLTALCINKYNNTHYLKGYPLDLHMIRSKVKPIPIHLWRYGMDHITGCLRTINDENLRMNLLPSGKASVRSEGIYHGGLYYTCERAIREGWFDRIQGRRTRHLEIVTEPIVDKVHIRLDHGRLFETCQLTPAYKRFAGKDWYEVREYFAWLRQQEREVIPDTQQPNAEFHAQMKRLISSETKATEEALKAANLSKSARSKNIRGSRNQLKSHERKHGPLSLNIDNTEPSTMSTLDILHTTEPAKQLVRPPSAEGYVPPAQPTDEIRAARERAKRKNEQR